MQIHVKINVKDVYNDIASEIGATNEVAKLLQGYINQMYSDYVTVSIEELSIEDAG